MTFSSQATFSRLRAIAVETATHAHCPYSGRREAAVVLLSDGSWIPGVRVESASFSLTIPPLLNAAATAVSLGRTDIGAAVLSRPLEAGEIAYAASAPGLRHLDRKGPDLLHRGDPPAVGAPLPPTVHGEGEMDERAGVSLARRVAARAHVSESGYPVGCVARTDDGEYIPGVNVEHPDWLYILCAERNVLGTCVSYRKTNVSALYLTCLREPGCMPCGACRQLIEELTPSATLWMDRGDRAPASSHPGAILPGSFTGERLSKQT